MRMPRHALPLVLLALAVVLAGCANPGEESTRNNTTGQTTTTPGVTTTMPRVNATNETNVTPQTLDYTATESGEGANKTYAFNGPAAAKAGWALVRLHNNGTEPHQAVFVRLAQGETLQTHLDAMRNATNASTMMTHGERYVGGVAAAAPSNASSTYVRLEPGAYVVECQIPGEAGPHMLHGMAMLVNVTSATGPVAAEPAPDLALTLKDFNFSWNATPTPGRHVVRVQNAGSMVHEAVVLHLASGKNASDALQWAEDPVGPPPFGEAFGAGALSPGQVEYAVMDLVAGDYAVVCFLPDATGAPHFTRGMVMDLHVG